MLDKVTLMVLLKKINQSFASERILCMFGLKK